MQYNQEDEYQMLFVLITVVYIVFNVSFHSRRTIWCGVFMIKVMSMIFGPEIKEVATEHGS
jgi:hypothetical protein